MMRNFNFTLIFEKVLQLTLEMVGPVITCRGPESVFHC